MLRYMDGYTYQDATTPDEIAAALQQVLERYEGAGAVRWSMDAIRGANTAMGQHYFEPSTMRFFRSRVMTGLAYQGPGGVFFVTSEQGPHSPRAFTVRYFDPKTGDIGTAGGSGQFQMYTTRAMAHAAAKRYAQGAK